MKGITSDWAYLSSETSRGWLHIPDVGKGRAENLQDSPVPARAVYAIPAFDLVSIPQWVSSKEDDVISLVVDVEVEKLGIKTDSLSGKLIDWNTVATNGTRTLIQSVAIPWDLPETNSERTTWTEFIPQYALYSPPPQSITLWKEGSRWVAGYVRDNQWVHVQNLGKDPDVSRIAKEISLTALELSARGFINDPQRLVVWTGWDADTHRALESEFGLPVSFEAKPPPDFSRATVWNFEPGVVSEQRKQKRSRQRTGTGITVFAAILAALAGAALFHIQLLKRGNAKLLEQIEANRDEAAQIEAAMDHWNVMSPAIDPKRSPVELFYQLSLLVPERGFRITAFEMQNSSTIVIRGEAASMAQALQFKGAVEKSAELSDYQWDIQPPRNNGDLVELFGQGSYRF